MSDMKCPFCGEKLYDDDFDVQLFACYGSSCKNSICKKEYAGTKELWQELIRTRKALEIIKKEMSKETMPDFAVIHNALKTALEQKDVK